MLFKSAEFLRSESKLCQQANRNFASEAQQLSKKLEEKEQEVRLTNVERARIQKHLQNLERLILRSVKPTVSTVCKNCDTQDILLSIFRQILATA